MYTASTLGEYSHQTEQRGGRHTHVIVCVAYRADSKSKICIRLAINNLKMLQ